MQDWHLAQANITRMPVPFGARADAALPDT